MPKITISASTHALVASKAICQFSDAGSVFNDNGTVSVPIDDEVYDDLHSRVDDVTPDIDSVLIMLCAGGAS